MQAAASAVKRSALALELACFQPATLKSKAALERIASVKAQALVVAAYGLILPQAVLDLAPYGALNIHASLLPRWRGAAPIQRALLAGDTETGVSIMQMDPGLDTGPLLLQKKIPIARHDNMQSLHDRLASLGADAIVEALAGVEAGRLSAQPQPSEGVTYARKIDRRESRLDWSRPAIELERCVRAFLPAVGSLNGEGLRIWRTQVAAGIGEPGLVLAAGASIIVACGKDALEIFELQRAGGRRMNAAEFLRGRALSPGTRLE